MGARAGAAATHSTLSFVGIVLAVALVAGAAGYGLLTLAASVTAVAVLLGTVLLGSTSLALVAPLTVALGMGEWFGRRSE